MPSVGSIIDGVVGSAESVSKFAPDRFRAQFMVGFGYASANRFTVELPSLRGMTTPSGETVDDPTSSEDRNMLCTAVNMPGRELQTLERTLGIENRKIASGVSFAPVQMTFYLTNTYSMRNYFGSWMKACVDHNPRGAMYAGYQDNYAKQVKVRQYTKNARKVARIKLIDAFPISVGSIELNNQLQTQVAEITVAMAYRTYSEKYEK